MKKVLVPVSIAALLLAGCSSESSDEAGSSSPPSPSATSPSTSPSAASPSPESTTLAPGSFTFAATDGGMGTLEVPGTPDPEIEAMRVEVGAPEVTYLTGNFDNRQGSESFDVYMINVYDTDGNEYAYQPAQDYVFEITPKDAPAEVYNTYVDLYNSFSTVIEPLQRADFVMVGPELPAEIAGIVVSNGFEDIPVSPK